MHLLSNTVINFHIARDAQWMEQTFLFLQKLFNMISLGELENYYYGNARLKNSSHITFDDGDESFYKIAFPLLKKYQIPASIYVSPLIVKERKNFWFQEMRGYDNKKLLSIISGEERSNCNPEKNKSAKEILYTLPIDVIHSILEQYRAETDTPLKPPMNINIRQLKEIASSGLVDIGAHTILHPILKNETAARSESEIKKSVSLLSELLDKEVISFAYPKGIPETDFDNRERVILKDLKIKLAFSTESRAIKRSDNPLCIPRKGITHGSKSFLLLKLLSGKQWSYMKNLLGRHRGWFV